MRAELELRAGVKQVETAMAEITGRVRRIDIVLSQGLSPRDGRGSAAAVGEYLAWLDRVEALGLTFVNANIVTQGLRLFYQGARRARRRTPDPAPRMREVKDLLETVRHNEQADLLALRAKRASLLAAIQKLASARRSGALAARPRRGSGARGIGWLQVAVLIVALLAGSILLDAVRPEVVRFLRAHVGLPQTTAVP
jgi:hypothetical protein